MTPEERTMHVYQSMRLHFMGKYDGWKYNFNMRDVKIDPALIWQLRTVHSKYPTVMDKVRYMYPAFRSVNAAPASPLSFFRRLMQEYSSWTVQLEGIIKTFAKNLQDVKGDVTMKSLFEKDGGLPLIMTLTHKHIFEFETTVLLFVLFPELNTIDGDDIVFGRFKDKVMFHARFMSLYVSSESTEALKRLAVDSLIGN